MGFQSAFMRTGLLILKARLEALYAAVSIRLHADRSPHLRVTMTTTSK